jgi:large subunit ribosomal protein L25
LRDVKFPETIKVLEDLSKTVASVKGVKAEVVESTEEEAEEAAVSEEE